MSKYDAHTEQNNVIAEMHLSQHNTKQNNPLNEYAKCEGKNHIKIKRKKTFSHTHTLGQRKRGRFTNYVIFATHNIMATRSLSSHDSRTHIKTIVKVTCTEWSVWINATHSISISLTFWRRRSWVGIPSFSSKLFIFAMEICTTENRQSCY